MHENLKYSICLDAGVIPLENEELLLEKGDLDENQKRQISDWQPVFSDTNYGTLFFIYAKFIGNKLTDKTFEINMIQFYLQNYSGGVSIGFNGYFDLRTPPLNAKDPDLRDPKYPSRSKFVIDIGLQGLHTDYLKKMFVPPQPFVVKQGDVFNCQSIFIPVDNSISKIYDENKFGESKFVDELFMERNGDEIFITSEGEDKLRALESRYQLVDAARLLSGGIDVNTSQNYIKPTESRGRLFPCQPTSSIFMVS